MIDIKKAVESREYKYFNDPFKLNIVGFRNGHQATNTFDDELSVEYTDDQGQLHTKVFKITTDPGDDYLLNPMNSKGCAILAPGQYTDAYTIGVHKGYKALTQRLPIKVYRDRNKDLMLDKTKTDEGFFGINIHRASEKTTSKLVDKWSAGCQVFADPKEFQEFLDLCDLAASRHGNKFTYTLIELDELYDVPDPLSSETLPKKKAAGRKSKTVKE